MNPPLLELSGLTKHYPVRKGLFSRISGSVRAVDGVDLSLQSGQTLGIVGESGCGKSTLGRLALRLIEPTQGRVLFAGTDLGHLGPADLRAQRRQMQIIFQDPYSSLNPRMTVGQILTEPLQLHGLHGGRHTQRVAELLQTVGLASEHAGRYPHEFSGGQRQRILLAGDVPSPANPPPGCPFHTRCRHVQSLCSQEPPPLTGPDQHAVACHFWRDIEPPPPMGSSPPNIRLQRLQSAFIN